MSAALLAMPLSLRGQKANPDTPAGPAKPGLAEKFGKLPLSFEANQGQADKSIRFLSRGNGYGLFLNAGEAVMTLHKADASGAAHSTGMTRYGHTPVIAALPQAGHASTGVSGDETAAAAPTPTDVIRMRLAGANTAAQSFGVDPLPGTANYMLGNDPAKWHTRVPTFAKVQFNQVYPGVDLVYYGNQRKLEYDFVVSPGASPQPIRLHFDGASSLRLNHTGDLVISASNGEIAFDKPVVYQMVNGERKAVAGSFKLMADNTAGFTLGSYDHSKPLVIDPSLVFSTYLGGDDADIAVAMAVDTSGNTYLTGLTYSTDFPLTPGAFESVNKAENDNSQSTAFVVKLNASGTALLYSTYLGGSGGAQNSQNQGDYGHSIAINSSGDAYIAGYTESADFPVTTGAYQTTNHAAPNGEPTGFVSELNDNGTGLIYSTYLGGSNYDIALGIVLDSSDNAYVSGLAFSTDFPTTTGAYQRTNNSADNGGWNAYVTKLNSKGSALVYSTYVGGSGETGTTVYNLYNMIKVAVDSSGYAYLTGYAASTDYPTTSGAFQRTNTGAEAGGVNAVVTKLNTTGSGLVYSTFIGGSSSPGDFAEAITVDSSGDAYIAGYTSSTNFPLKDPFQSTNKGASSGDVTAFVAKLNSTGSALDYSTYLGGSKGDAAYAITIDSYGDAYVSGTTDSSDFPVTTGAYQTKLAGTGNVFMTELKSAGNAVDYSTYLGGKGTDVGYAIALSGDHVYLTGDTSSSNFPVTKDAYETTYIASTATIFVSELNLGAAVSTIPTTTTLQSSVNPQKEFQPVTFTADVTPNSGTGVPTGSVVFSIDETTVATETLSSGKAEYTTSSLAPGPHYVLASYGGSTTYGSSGGSLTETITAVAATPTFSPAPGTYTAAVKVTIADGTSGATIYYTTNGDTPTTSSTKYTEPIDVTVTTTIKAIAVHSGDGDSAVASGTYVINTEKQTAIPVFSPKAGTYTSVQFVTITDATTGSTIYYTTNGATPTTSSTKYTGAITVMGTVTIKAIAVASDYTESAVATATYTIIGTPTALAYPATSITTTGATLNGIVDTLGLTGSYHFQYGTSSTSLTTSTTSTALTASTTELHESYKLTTLKAATVYYFEVVVTTAAGTATGEVLSFKTE
jgi:hypothetical protein